MKDCETKYRIMETALELIWHSSYDSVGVGEICKQAKINKGSFYHFFPSKESLAVAALEEHWQRIQPKLDQIFSPQKDPIQRLMDYCDHSIRMQKEKQEQFGFVCGCPYTTLGAEQCSQSEIIREASAKHLDRIKKYFVSAVKDAAQEGIIQVSNVPKKAQELFTFNLGAFTMARIYNDLKMVENLKQEFKELLGVKGQIVKG